MARIAEIYPRNPDDPLYVPNKLDSEDLVEILIGQIKQMMLTTPGEILGDPFFGVNLEGLLFEFNVTQKQLEDSIRIQLYSYCTMSRDLFQVDFTIGFFRGDYRDACIIEFAIGNNPVLGIKII